MHKMHRAGVDNYVTHKGKIRKLTPRECLNFQGFPKSFRFPDDMPVSQRYKQVGNAVTVTLIAKIAKIILQSL